MYTVSKGPSKILAKSRRGLPQNFEKFESIKESSKRSNSPESKTVPRPVFQNKKSYTQQKVAEEQTITPQHAEIIRYINDEWNFVVSHATCNTLDNDQSDDHNNNNNNNDNCSDDENIEMPKAASPSKPIAVYYVDPPNPELKDFKPFDLEAYWGRRLFNNITKSL